MKFRATYKCPDALHYAIMDALEGVPKGEERDEQEEELREFAYSKVGSTEYLTIEFDTAAGTATIVPFRF
jgi:hypothetical protein